jgi:hypothetical protein
MGRLVAAQTGRQASLAVQLWMGVMHLLPCKSGVYACLVGMSGLLCWLGSLGFCPARRAMWNSLAQHSMLQHLAAAAPAWAAGVSCNLRHTCNMQLRKRVHLDLLCAY